ncbi:ATP-binding cassette domain-containing protein [Ruminococcus flavefaciens]|uniref:ATP-binding cassette domain-containing protein n=1 Tax=Ruminococcus flavefaciens TaxID=1265 RepID=UPI000464A77B
MGISEELTRKFPAQLSGGEAQRSAMVRALINDPDIVFADEPTGALNSAGVKSVLDVLTNINNAGQFRGNGYPRYKVSPPRQSYHILTGRRYHGRM